VSPRRHTAASGASSPAPDPTLAQIAATAAVPRRPSPGVRRAREALAEVAAAPRTGRLPVYNDPRTTTEAALQGNIVDLATALDYALRYHTRDSRGSDKGFPDLCLVSVRRRRFVLAELKSEAGGLRPEQKIWAGGLLELIEAGIGIEYCLWRPSDWCGLIRSILEARPQEQRA
jgi:hypothetical protein